MHFVLFYDLVDNVLEARAPYREEHLALAQEAHEKGFLVMAGALSDPPDMAILVFKAQDRAEVEAFARADPYVANGVVTAWRVREWTVVIPQE